MKKASMVQMQMSERSSREWMLWVDTGGTFTDCLAVDPAGALHREKVLSSGALRGSIRRIITAREFCVEAAWQASAGLIRGFDFCLLDTRHPRATIEGYDPRTCTIVLDRALPHGLREGSAFEVRLLEEAPVLAARLATGTPAGAPFPAMSMRLATTRGTNALLEGRGAPVALFITRGFGDLLLIGNQQRPDLFALDIRKPDPLYRAVVEVTERIAADGTVLVPPEFDGLHGEVMRLKDSGIRRAAVAFMHSYINPQHERSLARYLLDSGFVSVSCSSDLAPLIKILPRAETAVVDAYLAPVIDEYLERVQKMLVNGRLHVMTSAGGLVRPQSYHAKDSLLSGPAGGVVGGVLAGRRSGFSRIITFDMGGTSTDVSRFDGDYDYVFEHLVGDAHVVAPALAVESVAAGGGSICRHDGAKLHVGPESAGADPGPACYGAGGPLTLTDVNLLLGRLDAGRFDIPINRDAARARFESLFESIKKRQDPQASAESLLEGLRHIATERMADAIRRISVAKGCDPKDYALVAFGGAGGQHACGVAGHLGIDTIVIPEDASLLSARGLGHASIEHFEELQVLRLEDAADEISDWIRELSDKAAAALLREGVERDRIEIRRIIFSMRLAGQESPLQIDFDHRTPPGKAFESKYEATFGYRPEGRAIEIESIRVVASSATEDEESREESAGSKRLSGSASPAAQGSGASRPGLQDAKEAAPGRYLSAWFDGAWRSVPAFERAALARGCCVKGPALIFERYSVTAVESGWAADLDEANAVILRRTGEAPHAAEPAHPEVVRLELFTHRFETAAREMGEMVRRTAISTNVKERLDFSCAVLDSDGELVVNAPHIPVHLGALGVCVRKIREVLPMEPGDVVVTNHPRFGGSHLPDVTVVTPVHLADGNLLGYVANRAHHAEIGGVRPGSMPPEATRLSEEGVVIPPTYLFRSGRADWETIRRLLADAPYPSRAVEQNLADLRAAVAANRNGAAALLKLAEEHGAETVRHYMSALKHRAASKLRTALRKLPDGVYKASESLDDGTRLMVAIDITGDGAHVDFAGTAAVHPKNLNMTPAVVNSVVIYVMRLLVGEPLPLNEGLMHAVTINVPAGLLNPPFPEDPSQAPAVAGGNVETSQRLVDTLLKALGLAACSQGTMNNVLFGTDRYSYYETVCGGAGAGPHFDGANAVHTHMTNTRVTDPEILEQRYPVRLERFSIRRDSGGRGGRRGGDGVIREISFLEKMSLSVVGQHRTAGPYGLENGEAGKPAVQRIVRSNGMTLTLDPSDGCEVAPGDRFILETPGGGGYGAEIA